MRQRHEGDHYPLEGSRSRAYRAGGRAECGNSDTGTGARRVGKRRLACKFAGEEEGMVVEQSIAAGTKVDRGSTVTVKLEILPTGSAEGQAA